MYPPLTGIPAQRKRKEHCHAGSIQPTAADRQPSEKNILRIPDTVFQASGIVINGRRIKSFVFTTDLAIIRNCDADAVFAVYPFTPQQAISDAIIKASYIPVFCGVGGGTTKGMRTVSLARVYLKTGDVTGGEEFLR